MRNVTDTDRNPEWVLRLTAHNTECTNTNTRLPSPRPNQIKASGNSAIAGSGLNIAVSVSSKSVPRRLVMARTVRSVASTIPTAYPTNSTRTEFHAFSNKPPDAMPSRSEEHTSGTPVTNAHPVCRLLLEKKNKKRQTTNLHTKNKHTTKQTK